MSGGFGRSYGRLTVVARGGGALVPVPGATVRLYLPGSTTPYGGALYPTADSLAPIAFPTTTDAGGTLDLWGEAPIRLDAEVSSAAYGTQRETLDLEPPPDAAGRGGVVFDVTTFGATGDGVTDETAALQAANAAGDATGRPFVLFFPPGVYLTDPLALAPRASIDGVGRDAAVLRNRSTSGGHFVHYPGSFGTVRNVTLDGQRAQQPVDGGLCALMVCKPNNPTAGGLNVAGGLLLTGPLAAGATSLAVASLGALTVLPGEVITLLEGAAYEIVRVAQEYAGGTSIALAYPLQGTFTTAATVAVASTGVVVESCTLLGAGRQGLAFWHAFDCRAQGNLIRDFSDSGIDAESGGKHLQLLDNQIEANGRWGITLDTAETWCGPQSETVIRGNAVRFVNGLSDPAGTMLEGIWIGNAEQVIVAGNLIDLRRGGTAGIRLAQQATEVTVTGNAVTGRGAAVADTHGIRFTGESGASAARWMISANLVRDCEYGINLSDSHTAAVLGNEVHTVTYGINLIGNAAVAQRVTIAGNVIETCTVGVRFTLAPLAGHHVTVRGNVIKGASSAEVDIAAGWTIYRDNTPPVVANTTGATLAQLETSVNALKAALRTFGALAA